MPIRLNSKDGDPERVVLDALQELLVDASSCAETWRDDDNNVLQFSHATVVRTELEPADAGSGGPNAQLTFDDWLEAEAFWDYHLNSGQGPEDEDEDGQDY